MSADMVFVRKFEDSDGEKYAGRFTVSQVHSK